tara:strand:- start:848 stop:2884 length:2037 start_codon:yes stop_codon:yes gene_type:complete
MNAKNYKPYIDGLRALAVLPVILFHADFDLFKGGYVGVDIFFVISGYLITNIIIFDLKKKKFSLKDFYFRRSRRILPALFFIVFLTLIFGIYLIPEHELESFGKQIFSVLIFLSNFFFWKNTGYFSPSSELQPLLHTWSLAVEEQFYIFFPIFFIIIWKFKYRNIIFILIVLSILSLILAQIGGNFKIQNLSFSPPFFNLPFELFWQAGSSNFYLPFGRAWELLTGSLISIYLFKNSIRDNARNNLFSILGFIFILTSIFLYSEELQYPSIFTILPVAGTSLVILYTTKKTSLNKILSFKPIVFLGLISYSFYLIHQPLFAFNRMYFGLNLNFVHALTLIFVSFILAIISWKYIETPFRDKNKINDKNLIKYFGIIIVIISSLSLLIINNVISNNKQKLSHEILNSFQMEKVDKCFDLKYAHLENKDWFCKIGKKNKKISFVLTGDSHALAIKPGFHEAAIDKNLTGIFSGFSACPPLLNVHSIRSDQKEKNCKLLNDKVFAFVKQNNIKKIFLVSKWSYYTEGNYGKTNFSLVTPNESMFSNKNLSRSTILLGLKETLRKYKSIGVKVYVINQIPLQIYKPRFSYSKSLISNKLDLDKLNIFAVDYEKHINIQKFFKNNLKIFGEDYEFNAIDFDEFFCNKKKCKIGDKKGSYYHDRNHLSIFGSLKLKNYIRKHLK